MSDQRIHVLHVPTRVHSETPDGVRWCFYCRRRVAFTRTVHVPTDPMGDYPFNGEARLAAHGKQTPWQAPDGA